MNTEDTLDGRYDSDSRPSSRNQFLMPFVAGVAGWIVGTLIVFGVSWFVAKSESVSSAVIWTISRGWVSFLFGLAVLIGYSAVARVPVKAAAIAYLIPVAVLAVIGGICLWIYPDEVLREELLTYLPVVLVFYLMGLLWMKLSMQQSGKSSSSHVIIPALVGGLVILGFVAVPVFSSDAFRYRDTFALKVSNVTRVDGVLRVEGLIEIRKPGNFRFFAPRYVWSDPTGADNTEPQLELGEISWGAIGEPQPETIGSYPMQIVWRKGGAVASPEIEDYLSIEVRNASEDNRVIHSMDSPIPAS